MKLPTAIACALLALGCSKKDKDKGEDKPTTKEPTKVELDAAPKPEPTQAADAAAAPAASTVIKVEGFSTPEAVLYDVSTGTYLVSNINGTPFDKDDNGFISKLDLDGKVIDLHFIDGAKADVTLHAPKGMASMVDTIYVADIDTVRMFDAKTGAPKGEVVIEGATFLNDIEPDGSGNLLLSDSGLGPEFKPTGTDAIYTLDRDGKILKVTKDAGLHNPNGVEQGNYVVTFGAKELLKVVPDAAPTVEATLEVGQLDGVVFIDPDKIAISSWECGCVLVGPPKGPFTKLIENVPAPASIGWDAMRKRLLIPLFQDNRVEIHPL